jgi:hypothetical protein
MGGLAVIFESHPPNGNTKAHVLLDQFRGQDFAEITGARALRLRQQCPQNFGGAVVSEAGNIVSLVVVRPDGFAQLRKNGCTAAIFFQARSECLPLAFVLGASAPSLEQCHVSSSVLCEFRSDWLLIDPLRLTSRPSSRRLRRQFNFVCLGDTGYQFGDGDVAELQRFRVDGRVRSNGNKEPRHVGADLFVDRDACGGREQL